ncbi:MAG: hypothetical protein HN726_03600 [Candidatus Magasanikbacteria bacterium]|jgi:hypothetical protein|nr:hypothetical protein [Candidatus Magasanikbacteria bacterium]MBT4221358.1 hypothetical protein [Candidatus Magasanikbacteria bacterium]MBT4350794.1 hypothetical protein [Candidatus Magasanikbacteria bacterium]MBT4541530.1 hypothetical protein [Candidatus Magasanikbacteria bacterium]MBT6253482.1 hypothetical protein [Candidatus Magasanikbacteria bacterium]
MSDKYTAVWVSHTSITSFRACPRSYYLKHMYKDPKTGHKIKIMSAPLALGQAVHEALESLSVLKTNERFTVPLMNRFSDAWKKVTGKLGGFVDEDVELTYKRRGEEMMTKVYNHPGPISNLSVKITQDLPHFWLSEEEQIILCGKVDWLEYLEDTDSVHIIDFKTGKNQEDDKSLQLPIYHLLVHECQKRKVTKASYWYLAHSDELTEKTLPDLEEGRAQILEIARKIKLFRQLKKFDCPNGDEGCYACTPYERVLKGEGEFVGLDEYKADMYILPEIVREENTVDSVIL